MYVIMYIVCCFRNTLTNLSVLVDVLSVAHDKKYLSLDPVSQTEAPPKPAVRLLSKRKVREDPLSYTKKLGKTIYLD